MPVVAQRASVAANGQTDFIAGTPYEFPGARGNMYTVYAVTEGAGVVLDVEFGSKVLARGVPLALVGANISPRTDQDMKCREFALPSEKVQCILRNTTGAAVTASILVDIA